MKEDSVFIRKVIEEYNKNPITMESLLSYKENKREKLGFNYFAISGSNGKGYTSIFYEFIYLDNKLISYQLEAQLPNDKRLVNTYKKFYEPLFKFNGNQPQPVYYGYEEMVKPLNNNAISISNKNIQFFMTPYSGTMYGDYGGIGSDLLDNRAAYISIKSLINPDICWLLLYSKNPATRLSAIEYYYQNSKKFSGVKQKFDNRIEVIFRELPMVSTMSADIVIEEKAQKLVNKFAKKE